MTCTSVLNLFLNATWCWPRQALLEWVAAAGGAGHPAEHSDPFRKLPFELQKGQGFTQGKASREDTRRVLHEPMNE